MAGASKVTSGRIKTRTLHPGLLTVYSEGPKEPVRTAPWVCKAKHIASYGDLGDPGRSLYLPENLAYARYSTIRESVGYSEVSSC